jgi:hypothetical protein
MPPALEPRAAELITLKLVDDRLGLVAAELASSYGPPGKSSRLVRFRRQEDAAAIENAAHRNRKS